MITSDRKIYDDTCTDDIFEVEKILFEDKTIIIALVVNKQNSLKVMINKITRKVSNEELNFYYAMNY